MVSEDPATPKNRDNKSRCISTILVTVPLEKDLVSPSAPVYNFSILFTAVELISGFIPVSSASSSIWVLISKYISVTVMVAVPVSPDPTTD